MCLAFSLHRKLTDLRDDKVRRDGSCSARGGVMVSAAALLAGFRTVKTELITVASTIAIPTICEAPVALRTYEASRIGRAFGTAQITLTFVFARTVMTASIAAILCSVVFLVIVTAVAFIAKIPYTQLVRHLLKSIH